MKKHIRKNIRPYNGRRSKTKRSVTVLIKGLSLSGPIFRKYGVFRKSLDLPALIFLKLTGPGIINPAIKNYITYTMHNSYKNYFYTFNFFPAKSRSTAPHSIKKSRRVDEYNSKTFAILKNEKTGFTPCVPFKGDPGLSFAREKDPLFCFAPTIKHGLFRARKPHIYSQSRNAQSFGLFPGVQHSFLKRTGLVRKTVEPGIEVLSPAGRRQRDGRALPLPPAGDTPGSAVTKECVRGTISAAINNIYNNRRMINPTSVRIGKDLSRFQTAYPQHSFLERTGLVRKTVEPGIEVLSPAGRRQLDGGAFPLPLKGNTPGSAVTKEYVRGTISAAINNIYNRRMINPTSVRIGKDLSRFQAAYPRHSFLERTGLLRKTAEQGMEGPSSDGRRQLDGRTFPLPPEGDTPWSAVTREYVRGAISTAINIYNRRMINPTSVKVVKDLSRFQAAYPQHSKIPSQMRTDASSAGESQDIIISKERAHAGRRYYSHVNRVAGFLVRNRGMARGDHHGRTLGNSGPVFQSSRDTLRANMPADMDMGNSTARGLRDFLHHGKPFPKGDTFMDTPSAPDLTRLNRIKKEIVLQKDASSPPVLSPLNKKGDVAAPPIQETTAGEVPGKGLSASEGMLTRGRKVPLQVISLHSASPILRRKIMQHLIATEKATQREAPSFDFLGGSFNIPRHGLRRETQPVTPIDNTFKTENFMRSPNAPALPVLTYAPHNTGTIQSRSPVRRDLPAEFNEVVGSSSGSAFGKNFPHSHPDENGRREYERSRLISAADMERAYGKTDYRTLHALAEKVYGLIEKKIEIEKERRGLA